MAAALWLAGHGVSARRALTVTFDRSGVWPAGPDYATDVLGDPWDFSNATDLSIDPNETINWGSNFAVSGGVVGGTTATGDAQIGLLYRGYYSALTPGKTGRRYPVDSSKYQKLSYRLSDSGGGNQPQIHWFHAAGGKDPADSTGQSGLGTRILGQTSAGYKIYTMDLTQTTDAGQAWANGSNVLGLRFDPNDANHAGAAMYVDWVRLTANDSSSSAKTTTVSWSGGSGAATVDVLDSNGTVLNVVTNTSSSSVAFNYGVLPPGTYTMRVTQGSVTGTKDFTINAPPLAAITDPDETGGEDFAAKVRSNAWDMDSSSDIQASANMTTPVFSGGTLTATNTSTSGDPNITLLTSDNATPIDSSRYFLLTFKFEVEGAFDVGNGSVARVLWGSQQFFGDDLATTTRDFIVWPGMNTYSIDLSTLSVGDDSGLENRGAKETWSSGSKRFFRFDPHEFGTIIAGQTRTFHIDDIALRAMDETVDNAFTIKWTGSDADTSSVSVSLYYDTDTDPSTKTLIQSGLSLSGGSTGWNWDTTSVSTGTYYIYILADDGVQTLGRYSTGKVRVVRPQAAADPLMALEAPSDNTTILQPFTASGWAIDRGAATGTGVDQVRVSVRSSAGVTTVLGDATIFIRRDDIGTTYGSQFINSGYSYSVSGLSPGTYTLIVEAHSTVTGTFNQSKTITFTQPTSDPVMSLDAPSFGATVGTTFTMSGWAIDKADPSGTGVDAIYIWAYVLNSDGTTGAGTYLGEATYGSARSDIGAAYGTRFTNSGYSKTASGLSAGRYRVVVYAHSKVSLTSNNQKSVDLTVAAPTSNPQVSIDGPAPNAVLDEPFLVGGWAIDLGTSSGIGVDAIQVWAYPLVNNAPDPNRAHFVAQGVLGGSRGDVAAVYGSQFEASGFTFIAHDMVPGDYEIHIYARSTVTGTYNKEVAVRVTIRKSQVMSIDGPTPNQVVTQPFLTGGWAADLAATSGPGVDSVQVWAFEVINGLVDPNKSHFVAIGALGGARSDVAALYGSQFANSGFTFVVNGLTPGVYEIHIYARSTLTSNPDVYGDERGVRVTIQ